VEQSAGAAIGNPLWKLERSAVRQYGAAGLRIFSLPGERSFRCLVIAKRYDADVIFAVW
jgi:hypothetical protein